MVASFDSAAKLGPVHIGVRDDVVVTRQVAAGGPRYVVHDPITFKNHLFSVFEYQILSAIVPARSLAQTFQHLVDTHVLLAERESAFYGFVLRLHGMGLFQLPIVEAEKLFERYEAKRNARKRGWFRFLFYHKIPLLNPDRFLERTQHLFGWIFSRFGIAVWLVLMGAVVWSCGGRLGELLGQTGSLLELSNLPFLWFTLIGLKVIHEFGHAYACRRVGGDVPEMGIVFILMTPCAYVDASSSWKSDNKWHRIGVAMGGMYVESIVAAIFALIWAGTAPGLWNDIALNVVALASVVTVLFNINPLVKFDGYFVFSDLVGVVNLQERASKFLAGGVRRFALGLKPEGRTARGRERWLYALYAPSAFIYRVFLAFTLTALAMMKWPGMGLVLGAIFVWVLMGAPLRRGFLYLWSGEDTEPVRFRARAVALGMVTVATGVLAFFPVSSSVVASGVLDPRRRASVRAPVSGFVAHEHAENGAAVAPGDLLYRLESPDLEVRRLQLEGEVQAERINMDVVEVSDPTRAAAHRERLAYAEAHLAEVERRQESAAIRAPASGTVVVRDPSGSEGKWVAQGEELVQVHAQNRFVRVVLTDHDVLRTKLAAGSEARLRWLCDPHRTVRAVVREIRRSASRSSVPVELTMLAGGDVYAEPEWDEETRADRPYLHIFLEADSAPLLSGGSGLTARILFPVRTETLGRWLKRRVLSFYNVWRMS